MIERIVDDGEFTPHAIWKVTVSASCPKCRADMRLADDEKSLICPKCDYSCKLGKSPDDVADDVIMHVKGNKHMKTSRILEQAKIETKVQKEEAGE